MREEALDVAGLLERREASRARPDDDADDRGAGRPSGALMVTTEERLATERDAKAEAKLAEERRVWERASKVPVFSEGRGDEPPGDPADPLGLQLLGCDLVRFEVGDRRRVEGMDLQLDLMAGAPMSGA